MKKFIKLRNIIIVSLFILMSSNINFYEYDVFAEEKIEDQNTENDIECNWPDDVIDPGPELPEYLSAPQIKNISNTNNGIKIQWKKVNNVSGYRIQRRSGTNNKWKDLKVVKDPQYTDKTAENGRKYQYRIYAYASNSIDFIESTGTKSITKKFLYLKTPLISTTKSQSARYKITWGKNKKADGYKIQISTSRKQKNAITMTKKLSTCKFTPKAYGIKKDQSCYIRIRAYKMDGKQLYYSSWSDVKILK